METFEFTIITAGAAPQVDDLETRLYGDGCDDALVSFQNGHVLVDFAREVESLAAAIAGAVENVRQAGATVERVEPDPLARLSVMVARANRSCSARANICSGTPGQGAFRQPSRA